MVRSPNVAPCNWTTLSRQLLSLSPSPLDFSVFACKARFLSRISSPVSFLSRISSPISFTLSNLVSNLVSLSNLVSDLISISLSARNHSFDLIFMFVIKITREKLQEKKTKKKRDKCEHPFLLLSRFWFMMSMKTDQWWERMSVEIEMLKFIVIRLGK
ncbi:hypothetical protein YC2023_120396 [Brassica napus]